MPPVDIPREMRPSAFVEVTSTVARDTEALVRDQRAEFTADWTTFPVADRLSTVRTTDRVLPVDDGRIVERRHPRRAARRRSAVRTRSERSLRPPTVR